MSRPFLSGMAAQRMHQKKAGYAGFFLMAHKIDPLPSSSCLQIERMTTV